MNILQEAQKYYFTYDTNQSYVNNPPKKSDIWSMVGVKSMWMKKYYIDTLIFTRQELVDKLKQLQDNGSELLQIYEREYPGDWRKHQDGIPY